MIIQLIGLALEKKEAIFLSSFILNYPKIIDKLVEASNLLKGKIYVLTTFEKNVIPKDKLFKKPIWAIHSTSTINPLPPISFILLTDKLFSEKRKKKVLFTIWREFALYIV